MKRLVLCFLALSIYITSSAQISDDFENNNLGWSENVSNSSIAIIKDGHLHLEGKDKAAIASCYAPFDINKPFELKCESFIKSLTGKKNFGLIMDYEDDMNFTLFKIEDDKASVSRFEEGKTVAHKVQDLKLKSRKKTGLDFKIEYTLQKITLFINDMRAIEYQRRMNTGQYMLGTTGIGFYADKNTVVDFDNLSIIQ